MAVPVARLHGPGLRAWSRSRTARSRAGPARRSRTSCSDGVAAQLGVPLAKVARHLDAGPGCLRPQRRRRLRCMDCRRAGQGGRQAGARAIHAQRRHRLGPEGPGLDPPRPARRSTPAATSSAYEFYEQGLLAHRRATPTAAARTTRWPATSLGVRAEVRRHASACRRSPTSSPTSARCGRRSRRCSTAPRRCAPRICAIRSGRRSTSRASRSWTRWRQAIDADPVEFRLKHVKDARDTAVIKAAAREVRLGHAAVAAQGPDRRQGDRARHRLCASATAPASR